MTIAPFGKPDTAPWIGAILHLTGAPPTLAALRERLAGPIAAVPNLGYRLADPMTGAHWVPAPPQVEAHVDEVVVPEGEAHLRAALKDLLRQPLPEDAAPWRLWLVSGYANDRYALFYRVSHALQDVAGLAAALEQVLAPGARSSALVPGLDEVVLPEGAAEAVTEALRAGAPASEVEPWVVTSHSEERTHTWVSVPSELLDAAGHGEFSRNDVYLAALAHAIGGWVSEHLAPQTGATIPAMIPMNTTLAGEIGLPGNRFATASLPLPGRAGSPQETLRALAALTGELKSRPGRLLFRRGIEGLRPDEWFTVLARIAASSPGVVTSSFGLRTELRLGDDLVTAVEPIGFCLAQFPLMTLLLTYGDVSTVDFVVDPSIDGIETLPGRWEAALRELAARP